MWLLPLLPLLAPPQAASGSSGTWLDRFHAAETALEEDRLDDAVTALESCLELAPGNATTAYHLACAHARAGRNEEAARWLVLAARWGYADPDVAEWDADLALLRESERFRQALEAMTAAAGGTAPDGESAAIEPLASDRVLAISPEGDWYVSGDALWHVDEPFPVRSLSTTPEGLAQAAWDPTGRWLVTAGRAGELVLRDGATGEVLRSLEGRGTWADAPSFSADGSRLTCAVREPDAGVRVWELPSGERRGAWFGTGCDRARLSASGRYLATLDRDNAWVWDVEVERWIARSKHVRSIRFEGEVLVLVEQDHATWRYAPATDALMRGDDERPEWRLPPDPPGPLPLRAVRTAAPQALSPLGAAALPCRDGTVRLVELRTARVLHELRSRGLPGVEASADGRRVVVRHRDGFETWEPADWTRTLQAEAADFPFEPDPTGSLVPVVEDRSLLLRRTSDGGVAATVAFPAERDFSSPDAVVWSADGSRLAVATEESLELTPDESGWPPDWARWQWQGLVCVFDASDGALVWCLEPRAEIDALALDATGGRVAVAWRTRNCQRWLSVHDVETGETLAEILVAATEWPWDRTMWLAFDEHDRLFHGGHLMPDFLEARDARTLALLWSFQDQELLWGVGSLNASGQRLVYGDNPFVFDADSGARTPVGRDLTYLSFVGEDRVVALRGTGEDRESTVVLDAAGRELYALHAYPGSRAIAVLPSGWVAGDVGIGEDLVLRVGGVPSDLEAYAARLYDPKRVAAAAAGVRVRAPRLPAPPELTDFEPGVGLRTVDDPCHLAATANDPSGILGFLLAIDGGAPRLHPGVPSDGASRLELDLPRPPGVDETAVVLRAVSRAGILGRPAVARLRWRE